MTDKGEHKLEKMSESPSCLESPSFSYPHLCRQAIFKESGTAQWKDLEALAMNMDTAMD